MSDPGLDYSEALGRLAGLPVSHAWRSVGSNIFIELGELTWPQGQARQPDGQASIHIGWDWRLEDGGRVVTGSAMPGPHIDAGIAQLTGASVVRVRVVGPVIPELSAEFSNGWRLRSMAMVADGPDWSVCLPDGTYVFTSEGRIWFDHDPTLPHWELSGGEQEEMHLADAAAARWGVPVVEPRAGACRDCRWARRIDAGFAFLDYLVCANGDSPLDGRVVAQRSGCRVWGPV